MLMMLAHLASGTLPRASNTTCDWPNTCPGTLPRMNQTWQMNLSTIIMPCNNTGFTNPKTTLGWGIVDFDWSNSKGGRLGEA